MVVRIAGGMRQGRDSGSRLRRMNFSGRGSMECETGKNASFVERLLPDGFRC